VARWQQGGESLPSLDGGATVDYRSVREAGREFRVPTRGDEQGAASRREFLCALAMPVALAAGAAPLAPREERAAPEAPRPPPVDSSLRAVREFFLPVGALPAIVFRAVPPEDS
jgi:hypothetical protein